MANVIALTAAAAPAAIAGIKSGANVNGVNSAAYTYANGAGALDTIDNTELKKGVSTTSRLYAFLDTSFATQAALDAAVAALGIVVSSNGGTAFRFVTAAPGKPTATMNGAVATGSLRIALGASATA